MIKKFKELIWQFRFASEVRRINPRISRRIARLWADDWLVTIENATSLSPEDSAREELSVWNNKGE